MSSAPDAALITASYAADFERCRLLCETGLDIQAISQAVGYGNRGNFSTAFRERFGMAPTALRQEQDPHA